MKEVSPNRKRKSQPARGIDTDVLKPVPRIDAVYLRNASHIVECCVIESLQGIVLDELVKAARTGAYEAALSVSGLCERFEQPVCVRSAGLSIVKFLQSRGIQARVGKGQTSRGGFGIEIIIVEATWREGVE